MDRREALGLKSATPVSGGGEGAPKPKYSRLPIVTANVARPGRRPAIMSVETGIDASSDEIAQRVTQSEPRLRAAYAEVVQRSANSITGDTPPDVETLISNLQAATDRILGRRGAKLLIGTVMVS